MEKAAERPIRKL